jgi:hypothetical protein
LYGWTTALAEVDRGFQVENEQFEAATGADGIKKLDELAAAPVESSLHQLFALNPHMPSPRSRHPTPVS